MEIPRPNKAPRNLNIRVSQNLGSNLVDAAISRGRPYSELARNWMIDGAKRAGVDLQAEVISAPV